MPVAAAAAAVVLAGTAAVALGWDGRSPEPVPVTDPVAPPLDVETPAVAAALLPGRTVTGSVDLVNDGAEPVEVSDVGFSDPTSDGCRRPGVTIAPVLPPTPDSPLVVPGGSSAAVTWTAYMDGSGDGDCQGTELRSRVSVDGEPAGTLVLPAGTLERPPAPVGGTTTSTRAAVQWSPSTAADPGWVVERAVAGTDDWQPACDSSPDRPVRALSCTDTGLSSATAYAYRVTLRTGHWHATSRPSDPVTTQPGR